VADYVLERVDGEYWDDWLQKNRVELNAMSTPQFIEWLDSKMGKYDDKVIPPVDVISDEYDDKIEEKLRDHITDRILREANIDQQVADVSEQLGEPDINIDELTSWLEEHPDQCWTEWVASAVNDKVDGVRQ
jgi:hypothetical protein